MPEDILRQTRLATREERLKSRKASKARKTKTKKGKIAEENTKKEDERRFSIFYRLVEAKGAPIILRLYIITYLKILELNIFKYYKITPFCAA